MDIQETKKLEETATQLADRLSRTLESITDGFFTLDQEWRFTYVNPEMERILDVPRDRLLGKVLWDEFPELSGTQFESACIKAARQKTTVQLEEYYDARKSWISLRIYPSGDGLSVFVLDITKRKKDEEQMRLLATSIASLNDIVIITKAEPLDEPGLEISLLCANQVWWEWDIPTGILKTHAVKDCILGYDLGKIRHHLDFWMDALPPGEREPVWNSLQEHLEGKSEMWAMEHRYKNPQGEYKWVLEAGKVVNRDADGSALRMVGITQNIHDKKMQDEELKRKNESLTEALKLRDIVLAGASHDVKNALNSGVGLASLLSEKEIGKTEEFAVIRNSLEKSAELVSKLHEISKGYLVEANSARVNISSIIEKSHAFHLFDAKNKELKLETNLPDENFATTDESIVRRIIDNLVGNAIKFTQSGCISISDISDSDTVIIEVADTGPGIPPDRTDQLFMPFNKFSDESEGSGLGLSICRDLAEKLEGKVSYRPNTPSGSIFRLEIPRELTPATKTEDKRHAPLSAEDR